MLVKILSIFFYTAFFIHTTYSISIVNIIALNLKLLSQNSSEHNKTATKQQYFPHIYPIFQHNLELSSKIPKIKLYFQPNLPPSNHPKSKNPLKIKDFQHCTPYINHLLPNIYLLNHNLIYIPFATSFNSYYLTMF